MLPESIVIIEDRAFDMCRSLATFTMPNSVTVLGAGAFENCTALEAITLSNSLTIINTVTFRNCTSLMEIYIPESVESIEGSAFMNCISLTSIYIPINVTFIGRNTFISCSNLTIYVEAESQPVGWHPEWNPDNRPVVWGGVSEKDESIEKNLSITLMNYPNPFNPSTTILFSLTQPENVKLQIFNVSGQIVKTLLNENKSVGSHVVTWDGLDDYGYGVTSGTYIYRINTDNQSKTKKMILLK